MTWSLAQGKLHCPGCGGSILKDEAFAHVTERDLIRCQGCMKKYFNLTPPASVFLPSESIGKVNREAVSQQPIVARPLAQLASEVRDGKLAQLSERDR